VRKESLLESGVIDESQNRIRNDIHIIVRERASLLDLAWSSSDKSTVV
jgi:hypothetical protein